MSRLRASAGAGKGGNWGHGDGAGGGEGRQEQGAEGEEEKEILYELGLDSGDDLFDSLPPKELTSGTCVVVVLWLLDPPRDVACPTVWAAPTLSAVPWPRA